LYTESTPGVFPLDGAINTSDLASAAFQTTGKFHHHLTLFIKRVEVCRTGINAEPFFAGVADFLIERDMGFFIVFKSIEGQLFGDLHENNLFFGYYLISSNGFQKIRNSKSESRNKS